MATAAGIDIGTNSVRLLINSSDGSELERHMQITRLGQGVDATGTLATEAMQRTVDVLQEYGRLLQRHGCTSVRMTATSAARDASNCDVFFELVENVLGLKPQLLSGDDEAKLSFFGATSDLPPSLGPFMVFDIGGGSTEFAFGQAQPERSLSLDMGGVRLTERFLKSDPPTQTEMTAARSLIEGLLDPVEATFDWRRASTWLGLAGTVTSFASHGLGLTTYDPERTHGSTLTHTGVQRSLTQFASVPLSQRERMLLQPKRASVIIGGALILDCIMTRFELSSIRVSEKDILDGLAASANGD